MNEPKRWLNDGASPVMEHLLRAAGREQPSAGSLERALTSVAAASGVAGVATNAGAAAVASSSGVFLKWTALACVVTLGTAGVGMSLSSGGDAESARRPPPARASSSTPGSSFYPAVPTNTATPGAPLASAASLPARPPPVSDVGTTRSAPVAAADEVVVDVDELAQETQLIERARAHGAAGRATAALDALDEYESRFPVRRYAPEALYLRMKALLALGQHDAARQVATRLATSYPNSPHAVRAESVRGGEKP
jgi:hypothetical protein